MVKVLWILGVWTAVLDAQTMRIYHKDSSSLGIELSKIDSIVPSPTKMSIYRSDSTLSYLYTQAVDSVVFQSSLDTVSHYGKLLDERDGQSYATMMIGERRWMAQNLNYGQMIKAVDTLRDGTVDKICLDDAASNCALYGGLYSWAEAMGLPKSCNHTLCTSKQQKLFKGICPAGWRLPTDLDWQELESALGMSRAGQDSAWVFRGAPLGAKILGSGFQGFGTPSSLAMSPSYGSVDFEGLHGAFFHSASEYNKDLAWFRALADSMPVISQTQGLHQAKGAVMGIYRAPYISYPNMNPWLDKSAAMSVRCVEIQAPDSIPSKGVNLSVQVLNPSQGTWMWRDSAGAYEGHAVQILALPHWGFKVKSWSLNGQFLGSDSRLLVQNPPAFAVYSLEFEADPLQGTMTDSRDGQVYKTVLVGGRLWMAQNLNYGTKGMDPAFGFNPDTLIYKSCVDNSEDSCAKYGAYYSVYSAFKGGVDAQGRIQGACPAGWHVSTDQDWQQLEHQMAMPARDTGAFGIYRGVEMGHALKQAQAWSLNSRSDYSGNSHLGFLPSGRHRLSDPVRALGWAAYVWTSTKLPYQTGTGLRSAYVIRGLSQDYAGVLRNYIPESSDWEMSVRCVQN